MNIINNYGDTPLITAAKRNVKENIRIFQKLIEFNADPLIENIEGDCFYSIVSKEAVKNKFSIISVEV